MIADKIGLFCASTHYNSLPMRAHYAQNASGLVIEFKELDKIFSSNETGILNRLISVEYEKENHHLTFDPKSYESLFSSKFKDWSYEREVRVLLPLSECHTSQIGSNSIWLYDIPITCVNRIILGWKMNSDHVSKIKKYAKLKNSTIEIVKAEFIHGSIQLSPPINY